MHDEEQGMMKNTAFSRAKQNKTQNKTHEANRRQQTA